MTTWITKELTLDLLAITIDWLNKTFDRINQDSPTPTVTAVQSPQVVPDPATTHPADMPTTAPAEEPTPEPVAPAAAEATLSTSKLLPQAQTLLRTIAQTEGNDWIINVLFPHFGVASLNDVPASRGPELIRMAQEHQESIAA